MTDRPFVYDERLLHECAASPLASSLSSWSWSSFHDTVKDAAVKNDAVVSTTRNSCLQLLNAHAAHYGRPQVPPVPLESILNSATAAAALDNNNVDWRRLRTFVETVVFVHQHNSGLQQQQQDQQLRHTVALNRFSDQQDVLPSAVVEVDWYNNIPSSVSRHERFLSSSSSSHPLRRTTTPDNEEQQQRPQRSLFTPLQDKQSILDAAVTNTNIPNNQQQQQQTLWGIGHGSSYVLSPPGSHKHHHHHHKNKQEDDSNKYDPNFHAAFKPFDYSPSKALRLSDQHVPNHFQVPQVIDPELDGIILSIKRDHDLSTADVTEHAAAPTATASDNTNNSAAASAQSHRWNNNDDDNSTYDINDTNNVNNDSDDDDDDDAYHNNVDFPPPPVDAVTSQSGSGNGIDNDNFSVHLNWATTDNPDGVSIVHDPFDQGACGACWAFAAAGSLEASAARLTAYHAHHDYLQSMRSQQREQDQQARHYLLMGQQQEQDVAATTESTTTTQDQQQQVQSEPQKTLTDEDAIRRSAIVLEQQATQFAQGVELNAFRRLNLSVQELIDCDTSADQGCTGGNPLLAFYFIHQYGLTGWNEYPYVGFQDTCKQPLMDHPVAKVHSWGIISPNHENHMELVLRYIGPIAVGVNGASKSFLSYSGGIFNQPDCEQGANHALLITGYGQETDPLTNETVRYFIARNSWGTGWGEQGYIRIQRGDGRKGTAGVCGIARSPSVALGGIFLSDNSNGGGDDDDDHSLLRLNGKGNGRNAEGNSNFNRDGGPLGAFCRHSMIGSMSLEDGRCMHMAHWTEDHKALTMGLFGIFFGMLSLWPLTRDCRRRRRSKRLRDAKRKKKRDNQKENGGAGASGSLSGGSLSDGDLSITDVETSPLMAPSAKDKHQYGGTTTTSATGRVEAAAGSTSLPPPPPLPSSAAV